MARRITSPIIVGRAFELGQLLEALDRVTVHQPGVVVISGEAGVGKTAAPASSSPPAACPITRSPSHCAASSQGSIRA